MRLLLLALAAGAVAGAPSKPFPKPNLSPEETAAAKERLDKRREEMKAAATAKRKDKATPEAPAEQAGAPEKPDREAQREERKKKMEARREAKDARAAARSAKAEAEAEAGSPKAKKPRARKPPGPAPGTADAAAATEEPEAEADPRARSRDRLRADAEARKADREKLKAARRAPPEGKNGGFDPEKMKEKNLAKAEMRKKMREARVPSPERDTLRARAKEENDAMYGLWCVDDRVNAPASLPFPVPRGPVTRARPAGRDHALHELGRQGQGREASQAREARRRRVLADARTLLRHRGEQASDPLQEVGVQAQARVEARRQPEGVPALSALHRANRAAVVGYLTLGSARASRWTGWCSSVVLGRVLGRALAGLAWA